MTELVRYKGVLLRVNFDYQPEDKASRYSPPSPESVDITSIHASGDIAELLEGDPMEEIVKLVLMTKQEV